MVPGPFLLDVLVEGERVKKAFLDLGYIHKGIEKIMENRTWLQGITYTDRMCYVASLSNNECYCGAVERILGLEVPERAQYIRVILEELSRIQSHLIGTGEFLTLIAGVGYRSLAVHDHGQGEDHLSDRERYRSQADSHLRSVRRRSK